MKEFFKKHLITQLVVLISGPIMCVTVQAETYFPWFWFSPMNWGSATKALDWNPTSPPGGYLPEILTITVDDPATPTNPDYEGLSDVEQLIGLQDELNTRLSDRANRITFQAFKMYLAKGIEGFEDKPISPGRMWCTDNPDSSIEEFGGDGASPSEDMHIVEIREAMDKISGVTPVVAGVLKNKLGNLTSSVALKMTFMGMLAKTARKQFSYGQGIKQ